MSIIDEKDGDAEAASQDAPSTDTPFIKLRNKRGKREDGGKLRPTSIHIFEDLEKNGVIPDKALSSYKAHARRQRMSRNMQALYSIDPLVAKDMFEAEGVPASAHSSSRSMSMTDIPSSPKSAKPSPPSAVVGNDLLSLANSSPGQIALASSAALIIQRHFRGFLGRRLYAARLWEVFAEEEEKQRKEREKNLIEETEILVEASKARIDMEELETVKRNAKRLLVSRVVTIQRAWRSHRAQLVRDLPVLALSRLDETIIERPSPALASPPSSMSCDSLAEHAATKASGFDREAIRRQLASDDDELDVRIVGPATACRRRRFSVDGFLEVTLNDILEEVEAETGSVLSAFPPSAQEADSVAIDETDNDVLLPEKLDSVDGSLPLPQNIFNDVCDQLRNETEIQLAQTPALAHLQMELEKSEKLESPSVVDSFQQLKDMVRQNDIDEAEIGGLNVASLQVLVNDLLTRVELNNEELMALLQERDQLHMEQDSMLVDIEDLIKQCKRQAELNSRRSIPK